MQLRLIQADHDHQFVTYDMVDPRRDQGRDQVAALEISIRDGNLHIRVRRIDESKSGAVTLVVV